MNDLDTKEGLELVKMLTKGMYKGLKIDTIESQKVEMVRFTHKMRTTIYDLAYIVNDKIYTDLEAQKYGSIDYISGKFILNSGLLIR